MAYTTGSGTAGSLAADILTSIQTSGWTLASSTASSPDGLSVTIEDVGVNSMRITVWNTAVMASRQFFITHYAGTGVTVNWEMAAGKDFFYLCAGGVIKQSVSVWPLNVYDTVNDTNVLERWVAVGLLTDLQNPPNQADAYVMQGNGVPWAPGRLFTMRPAIQDAPNNQDSAIVAKTQGMNHFWPFVFVDNVTGRARGALGNIYHYRESYSLGADIAQDLGLSSQILISGVAHRVIQQFLTNSNGWSPYGIMPTNHHPLAVVKE
jgi:hypothetical protein